MTAGVQLAGWRPGALGRVVQLHGGYYGPAWGFSRAFEIEVAEQLAGFLAGFEDGRDLFLTAIDEKERIIGSLTLDRHGAATPQTARLRWIILDDAARGRGVGRMMMDHALAFARKTGVGEVYLWTFAGLEAARALYAAAGFTLTVEKDHTGWGPTVRAQEYRLPIR